LKAITAIAILDDERLAVDGMVFQLSRLIPEATVCGFTQPKEFLSFCETQSPDLVFLDMEMPNTTGLEVAAQVKALVGNIIFVTAHSEYSLAAFDTAIDYILKPVSPKRLEQSLEKVARLQPVGLYKEQSIKIPIKGSFHEIPESKINSLRGQRNYTEVVMSTGEKHLVARTLKSFEESLSSRFSRIHKSIIIRKDAVKSISWGSKIMVYLVDGFSVEASKSRMEKSDWDAN